MGISAMLASMATAEAQMSPGELARAHQSLDSPLRCAACHEFGARRAQFRCLECHGEIRRRLEARRGYHARVVRGEGRAASNDCARCHSEHNGRNHRLVRWPRSQDRFDHKEAGWPLEGRHARLECRQCHQGQRITPEDRAVLVRTDLNSTFAGLDGRCTSCHRDEHHGSLGQDCRRCHTAEAWKPAPGFTHTESRFPLTGRHEQVPCARCHKPIAALGGHAQYRNFVQFENCISCHADPHGGAFAGGCEKCHTTEGWKGARIPGTFDHSRTAFPLRGRHAALGCRKCHRTENFRVKIAHDLCRDCHEDRHQGQFAGRNKGECAACHTEDGWKPARFGVEEHATSRFPLRGAHARVECGKCHAGRGGAVNYHPPFANCRDCHRDPHEGQFAGPPHQDRCQQCHVESDWKKARYSARDHQTSRFPLHGAHAAVPCEECHKATGGRRQLRFADIRCAVCHADLHRTMKELAEGVRLSAAAARQGCEGCHSPRAWNETAAFDHGRTRFDLTGKHKGVKCRACHKPDVLGSRRVFVFAGTPQACTACHADPHMGQFARPGAPQGECAGCHTTSNWLPTEFDHERLSSFPLTGAHRLVPCRMCHPAQENGGRRLVQYRGTPRVCEECHR